jgi:hypothetical protein
MGDVSPSSPAQRLPLTQNTSIVDFLANYTTNATALIESDYFDLLTNGTNLTRGDAYFFYNNTARSIIESFDLDNSSGLNLTEFQTMLNFGTFSSKGQVENSRVRISPQAARPTL